MKSQDQKSVQVDEEFARNRRKKLMLSAVLFGVCAALIFNFFFRENFFGKKTTTEPNSTEKNTAQRFDGSGKVTNPQPNTGPQQTPEELLKLAKETKKAGLILQGRTECGWSRRQRDMFGKEGTPARDIIDSIYVECRNAGLCPGAKGYPNWVHGDQHYPGYRDHMKLKTLINQVAPLPDQPMLQGPSEPIVEANIKDRVHTVDSPKRPEVVKSEQVVEKKNTEAILNADLVSKAENVIKEEGEIIEVQGAQVENVRGVSSYPPLNPMVMPGTSQWQMKESHPENQFRQGNLPRESLANHDPVVDLARQMASTFSQIANDSLRDPNDSAYSRALLPQSATITTGEAFDDRRIYVEPN